MNLFGFEDVTGLEDLFGVSAGTSCLVQEMRVPKQQSCFASAISCLEEYTSCDACAGIYRVNGAEILIDGETPLLFINQTATGRAALFNISPHNSHPC